MRAVATTWEVEEIWCTYILLTPGRSGLSQHEKSLERTAPAIRSRTNLKERLPIISPFSLKIEHSLQ